ncbi:putative Cactus-binding C-terminus of cactin protein [Monocercomonoides exilis]|uniref:putative Cactus-binding C-terminus of cactin protein n=1 Tax=Monocercomonoides exilis TaxID=2049356 RepID=UPI0035593883|nr:putative Cactus-binding C-terminus of cactin protein [Monocercomonoides exilis]
MSSSRLYAGYTNESNPFGDSRLGEKFVWHKKNEKLKKLGLNEKKISKEEKRIIQEERFQEIERARQKRLQNEEDKKLRELQRLQAQKDKDLMDFEDWRRQEHEFHTKQVKLRSEIRVKQGRAQPIDFVARNLRLDEDQPDFSSPSVDNLRFASDFSPDDVETDERLLQEPYQIFNGMTLDELKNTEKEISAYKELDQKKNKSFWAAMRALCVEAIRNAQLTAEDIEKESQQPSRTKFVPPVSSSLSSLASIREGASPAPYHRSSSDTLSQSAPFRSAAYVKSSVHSVLSRLSAEQLAAVGAVVAEVLERAGRDEQLREGLDIDYLDTVQKETALCSARAVVRERHRDILQRRLEQLERKAEAQEKERERAERRRERTRGEKEEKLEEKREEGGEMKADEREIKEDESRLKYSSEESERDSFERQKEQKYEHKSRYEKRADEEDLILGNQKHRFHEHITSSSSSSSSSSSHYGTDKTSSSSSSSSISSASAVEEGAQEDDAVDEDQTTLEAFDYLVPLDKVYRWSDKYRPRKPKYFNRIRTGYEWNKYNKTHFDIDNPPPKTVMGYRFNIFYPDLIDKTRTPRYITDEETEEYKIIRFHAGPPYEDIAFKIVNKEWEYRGRRGFVSSFDNGVLRLYFNFKRLRYRR